MGRLHICLTCALIATSWGRTVRGAYAAEDGPKDAKRTALWDSLNKVLTKDFQQIDVYGESSAIDAVLFRSKGKTLLFSLRTGKLGEVIHMKSLGPINRISFEDNRDGGDWVLWFNGRRESTIDSAYETEPLKRD
jgi:hypothetical protein